MGQTKAAERPNTKPGRYNVRGVQEPAGGLQAAPPSLAVRTAVGMTPDPKRPGRLKQTVTIDRAAVTIGAVADPMDARRRVLARINRRVDVLEAELSNSRISEDAYLAGRIVQGVFERSNGSQMGSSSLCEASGGNPEIARERSIIRALENAQTVEAYRAKIKREIGEAGWRALHQVLGANRSFRDIAGPLAGDRRLALVAGLFRSHLEALAAAWFTARGRG